MGIKIKKTILELGDWKVGAMLFLPGAEGQMSNGVALFTHGYTSHKGSLLTWATRLAEEGMPSLMFDLPGHYLGTFSEVTNFEDFKLNSHKLFELAFDFAISQLKECEIDTTSEEFKLVLGGHSLGALLALKASELDLFESFKKVCLCVGLGITEEGKTHIFQTPFYKSTLVVRSQLVSPELEPDNVFPWIKSEKKNCTVSNQRVHLICGQDDLVVGDGGVERLSDILKSNGNHVTVDLPNKLPHHTPEAAAGFIKKFLKSESFI
ncbi:MAG: alpha/beta fold hydrolase [Bacteriovoracaceae bacterium]|nr:alpha/beta fold hydrolase [Bacteriovoracaceae bacterium]